MKLGYRKQVGLGFTEAAEKTRKELSSEGFGVITEVDVKKTFKNKLGVDFEGYLILGACQPDSALKVLQCDKELGLMLPCNVIVYEDKGKVFVSAILPSIALGMTENNELARIALEVEEKLKRVVDQV